MFILPVRAALSPYSLWSGVRGLFGGTQEERKLDSLSWPCLLVLGRTRASAGGHVALPWSSNVSDRTPFLLKWWCDRHLSGSPFRPLILHGGNESSDRLKCQETDSNEVRRDFSPPLLFGSRGCFMWPWSCRRASPPAVWRMWTAAADTSSSMQI